MYDKFITGFCKVEFLCYQGEPNWLGWLVLSPIIIIIGMCIIGLALCMGGVWYYLMTTNVNELFKKKK